MLAVVAVVAGQGLLAVRGIVGRVQVNDDVQRRRAPAADEPVHQEVVEDLDAPGLGGVHVVEGGAVLLGQFVLAAGVGVLEAGQGGAAGQGAVRVGGDVGQDLE
jgi:hypothetical protein